MPTKLSTSQLNAIQAAVDRGDLIVAIRLYREDSGVGLAEAKAFVESLRKGPAGPSPAPAHAASDFQPNAVQALLFQGNLIEAIKRHREQHPGMGLAQAKQEVEFHALELRQHFPERFSSAATAPSLRPLLILLVLTLAGAVLLYFLIFR